MSRRVSRIRRIGAARPRPSSPRSARRRGALADPAPPDPPAAADQQRADKEIELRGVEDTLRASEDQRRADRDRKSSPIRADRARLSAALIETTAKVQDAERGAAAADDRLASLNATADELSHSLERRRGVIADVLAALQRMGSDPPPAILVKPDDMSEAVRAATVLGSVIPELKSEIEAARQDIDALAKTRDSIARERDELTREGRGARARQNASRRAHRRAPAVAGLGAGRARLAAAARGGTRQTGDVAQGSPRQAGQRKRRAQGRGSAAHATEVARRRNRGAGASRARRRSGAAEARNRLRRRQGTRGAARRGRDIEDIRLA